MVDTKMMALIAVFAFIGSVASALAMPVLITEVSAQGNMTGNMTGNYSDTGSNETSGNISGAFILP